MRISSRTRNAAIAMLHLAREYGNGPVAGRKISADHEISPKYLENIMRSLITAGLVSSIKGKKGGYMMARQPKDISVYDVFLATDGQPDMAYYPDRAGSRSRLDTGTMRDVWYLLGETISGYLKSVSFRDMIEKQKQVYAALRRLKKEFQVF
jgi:Rrf2 family transcriptional regulator, cysteine metabolism repressor